MIFRKISYKTMFVLAVIFFLVCYEAYDYYVSCKIIPDFISNINKYDYFIHDHRSTRSCFLDKKRKELVYLLKRLESDGSVGKEKKIYDIFITVEGFDENDVVVLELRLFKDFDDDIIFVKGKLHDHTISYIIKDYHQKLNNISCF